MTEEDRANWLTVAAMEVADVPSIWFADACKHARRNADHPSKIVPMICNYDHGSYATKEMMAHSLEVSRAQLENIDAPRLSEDRGQYAPDEALREGMRNLVEELRGFEGQKPDTKGE